MSTFKRKERFMINYQWLQLKKLVKEKQIKARVSRRNQWHTKQIVELAKPKSGSLEMWIKLISI